MSARISLLVDRDDIPLEQIDIGVGTWRGREVRQILSDEISFLEGRIGSYYRLGVRCRFVLDSERALMRDLTPESRHVGRCLIPFLVYSCSITFLITSFAAFHLGGEEVLAGLSLSAAAILSVAACVHSCCVNICHQECIWLPWEYKQSRFVKRLERRMGMLAAHPTDDFNPLKVAELIAKTYLRASTETKLFELATVLEFKIMLKEVKRLGRVAALALNGSQAALQILFENPPRNINSFREIYIRAKPALKSNDDYEIVKNRFPLDDPRRSVFDGGFISAASSSESISIDVQQDAGGKIAIVIGEESIVVDIEKIKLHSKWFSIYFSHAYGDTIGSTIAISSSYPHQKMLVEVLKCFDGDYANLWNPLVRSNKDRYELLFDCLQFYGFNLIAIDFGRVLIESEFIELSEKTKIAASLLSYEEVTKSTITALEEHVFSLLIKRVIDNDEYVAWLDFAIKHFPHSVLPSYIGYLRGQVLQNRVIVELVQRREAFAVLMFNIIQTVRDQLNNSDTDRIYYSSKKEFVEWCAEMMRDPKTEFLTLNNFKNLWHSENWRRYPCINEQLISFASKPANSVAIVNLWDMGNVPNDLFAYLS